MKSKFTVGQRVRILPKEQLLELEHNGADITEEMFEYGGKEATIIEATIIEATNCHRWLFKDLPEYRLDIDEEDEEGPWVWYEDLLEPIE